MYMLPTGEGFEAGPTGPLQGLHRCIPQQAAPDSMTPLPAFMKGR
jgi:hypothetical protein